MNLSEETSETKAGEADPGGDLKIVAESILTPVLEEESSISMMVERKGSYSRLREEKQQRELITSPQLSAIGEIDEIGQLEKRVPLP